MSSQKRHKQDIASKHSWHPDFNPPENEVVTKTVIEPSNHVIENTSSSNIDMQQNVGYKDEPCGIKIVKTESPYKLSSEKSAERRRKREEELSNSTPSPKITKLNKAEISDPSIEENEISDENSQTKKIAKDHKIIKCNVSFKSDADDIEDSVAFSKGFERGRKFGEFHSEVKKKLHDRMNPSHPKKTNDVGTSNSPIELESSEDEKSTPYGIIKMAPKAVRSDKTNPPQMVSPVKWFSGNSPRWTVTVNTLSVSPPFSGYVAGHFRHPYEAQFFVMMTNAFNRVVEDSKNTHKYDCIEERMMFVAEQVQKNFGLYFSGQP